MAGGVGAITLEVLAADAVPPEVTRLYERAFPAHERLPVGEMLSWGTGFRMLAGDQFCGLAFVSVCNGIAWLLFFAIAEGLRGQGLGGRALACLEERYLGHRFIVDVEALDAEVPNRAERQRRIDFWQHNGFEDAGFGFNWRGEQYAFLVKGGTLTYDEVRQFWRH
ncbi:MAG: hypothetical protein II943_09635 [Victivallales bacterium]|nr:hypothetical protein [Victivallales bacterium]